DATNRLRSTLPEADIVLPRAALVGVALEPHLCIRVRREITGVRGEDIVVLGRDIAAVVLEVDDELVEQVALRVPLVLDAEAAAVPERIRRRPVRALTGGGARFEIGERAAAVTTAQHDGTEDASQQGAGSNHFRNPQNEF